MKITVHICPSCEDEIFSRARHDMRHCSCGEIFIDGGFDYTRGGFKDKPSETKEIDFIIKGHEELTDEQIKQVLYNDWNWKTDKFGLTGGEQNGI